MQTKSIWTSRALLQARIAGTPAPLGPVTAAPVKFGLFALFALFGFALLGSFTMPSAAQAQSHTFTSESRVGLIEPLTITKLQDLDFGDLVVTSGGTVVLTPNPTASCTATGGVIHSAECQAAVFGGSATTGQRIRVRRPINRTITLTGPGADMTVTDITINGNPTLTPVRSNPNWERFLIASSDGTFVFRVGGTLNVNANQTPGIYTGTFDIRLDYQ